MGVSATGKTTIGRGMAEHLGMHFIEGDTFHPQANIDKMSASIALDDDDRRPWLEALAKEIHAHDEVGISTVTACSALRRIYRDWLRAGEHEIFFVHLNTGYEVLLARMEKRSHFMPPSLLKSQFETLELLQPDESGAEIDDSMSIDKVLAAAIKALKGSHAAKSG